MPDCFLSQSWDLSLSRFFLVRKILVLSEYLSYSYLITSLLLIHYRKPGLLWPLKNTKFTIIFFHLESVVAQNKHRHSKEQPILPIGCGYCYSKSPKSWFLWSVPNSTRNSQSPGLLWPAPVWVFIAQN